MPVAGYAAEWEVIAEHDGIVVSQRLVEGHKLPQLRSQGEVAGTPYEILAILLDFSAYCQWVPDCAEARILGQTRNWRSTIYTLTEQPWPVEDREAVIDQEVLFVRAPVLVKVVFRAISAPEVARRDSTVRVELADGSYTIEAMAERRSRVTYLVHADPGGGIPDWLIAMQSRRNPLETLAGLRRRLEETRGRYAEQIAQYPSGN